MRALLLLLFPFFLVALENLFQFRGGYFYFVNSVARDIYNNGSFDIEVEDSIQRCAWFAVWVNLNYTWRKGHSLEVLNPTYLSLGTLSIGPKVFFPIKKSSRSRFYLGIGGCSAYIHIKDVADSLPRKTIRWSLGCVGKSGFLFQCTDSLFLDLFCDYYYQPTRTRKSNSMMENSIDLGGVRVGLGIGCFY